MLESSDTRNVWVRVANGTFGWPDEAPFDRILVAAGGPSVPPPLFEQLAEGGRMVMPVGGPDERSGCSVIEKARGEMRDDGALGLRVREAHREVRVGGLSRPTSARAMARTGRSAAW